MHIKNLHLGKVRLMVATTLTLLLSVAQSTEARVQQNGMDAFNPVHGSFGFGFERELPQRFMDIDELSFFNDSNAKMILSRTDKFGELSVTEIRSSESTRKHFNFRSHATDQVLSATLVVKNQPRLKGERRSTFVDGANSEELSDDPGGAHYSLSFDLPGGQILLENDTLSVMTASDFARMSLSESEIWGSVDKHFSLLFNDVLRDSDMVGFSLSMAESLGDSGLPPLPFSGSQNGKGDNHHTEGPWACGGALIALAAANAALAAVLAGTYVTFGMAAATIAGAVSAIGAAMAAVDIYCLSGW